MAAVWASMNLRRDELGSAFAFLDPHGGKRDAHLKKLGSRSAICVGAADTLGRIFVLYAWAARCSTEELIEKIYYVNRTFMPKVFGVESNGLAALFTDALARDAKYAGIKLPLSEVFQPTHQEKDFRIRTILQPIVGHGRLFIDETDPGQRELYHEITTFPQNPIKDLIDACASMCRLIPPPVVRARKDVETERLLKYLRSTGASEAMLRETARKGSFHV